MNEPSLDGFFVVQIYKQMTILSILHEGKD